MAIAPECERGLVSIMGHGGHFMPIQLVHSEWNLRRKTGTASQSRFTFGGVKIIGNNEIPILLSGDTLVLAASEIFGEYSIIVIFLLSDNAVPFR